MNANGQAAVALDPVEPRQLLERGLVVGLLPGPPKPHLDRRTVALGEMVEHVSLLVLYAPLYGNVVTQLPTTVRPTQASPPHNPELTDATARSPTVREDRQLARVGASPHSPADDLVWVVDADTSFRGTTRISLD